MSTSETEETGQTAPIVVPPDVETEAASTAEATPELEPVGVVAEPVPTRAVPVGAPARDLVYVPLAVSVGDGFKFGCGFFLAFVLAMLVGFVVLAALFALTSIFGVNLPLGR